MKKILCAVVLKIALLTPTLAYSAQASQLTREEDQRMKEIVSVCSEAVMGKMLQDHATARAKGLEMHFALVQANGLLKEVSAEAFAQNETLECFVLRGKDDPVLKHRFVPVEVRSVHAPPNT